ncbi:MAG: hypothetical protein ACOCWO_00465 [Candidatus Muiribacteriaceae bacterium]
MDGLLLFIRKFRVTELLFSLNLLLIILIPVGMSKNGYLVHKEEHSSFLIENTLFNISEYLRTKDITDLELSSEFMPISSLIDKRIAGDDGTEFIITGQNDGLRNIILEKDGHELRFELSDLDI